MPFSKPTSGGLVIIQDNNNNNIPDKAESLSDGTTTITLDEVKETVESVDTLETEVTQLDETKLDKDAPIDGGGF